MQFDLLRSPRDLDLMSIFYFDLSRSPQKYVSMRIDEANAKHDSVKIIALFFSLTENSFAQKCHYLPFVTFDT